MIFTVKYLISIKKIVPSTVLVLSILTSCYKNTYMNTRAIAPVFVEKQIVQGELYLGQGIGSIGGNIALSPVKRTFMVAGFNASQVGIDWDAGIGLVPIKYKMFRLSMLSTYGKALIYQEFSSKFHPIDYGDDKISINAEYEKYSTTGYISIVPTKQLSISFGARFNWVQYYWYNEKRSYYNDSPKDLIATNSGVDSLSFTDNKSFRTLDPFVNIHIKFNKYVGIAFQGLYSYHETFIVNGGHGVVDTREYSGATPKREHYTYSSELPSYKKLVLNLAVVVVF